LFDFLTAIYVSELKTVANLGNSEKNLKAKKSVVVLGEKVTKKALIELTLVEECAKKANQEIINEIFAELFNGEILIPWCKQVTKVAIIDS
jgi:hypothetical protein